MAITSVGYDGSINETQWAKLVPLVGSSHYGVATEADWKVTPHATMDRGVNIAVGDGWGHGVLDTNTATVSLQGAAVSSGSRWDMVVARRNWSGTGGNTTFILIGGSSAKALPARNTAPGTLDDQPIALVKFTAGQTAAQEIVDLRCWGRNGGMAARDDLALGYLKQPGTSVIINGTTWNCTLDTNGLAVWTSSQVMGRVPLFGSNAGSALGGAGNPTSLIDAGQQFLIQAGSTVQTCDGFGYARLTFPKPFPNGLITVIAMNGDDFSSGGAAHFSSAGGNGFGASGQGTRTDWVYAAYGQPAATVGGGSQTLSKSFMANRTHRINWIAIGW